MIRARPDRRAPGLLVLTPALTGGSWVSIQRSLSALADEGWRIDVLALGKSDGVDPRFRVRSIPFPRYDKHGWMTTAMPAIGFLWNLPLLLIGLVLSWALRPTALVHNGLTSALTLGPAARPFGRRSVVMYHGYVDSTALTGRAIRVAAKAIDLAVVNSRGSEATLAALLPAERIVVSEHFADPALFDLDLRSRAGAPITILYVGRLDADKHCQALIQAARDPRTDRVHFAFAGVGAFDADVAQLAVTSPNVTYHGYVSDRHAMVQLYGGASVVWSYADDSYLALPAVEGLAAGCPIVIPEIVAIASKAARGVRVDPDLVPPDIGWLVDSDDHEAVVRLIESMVADGISPEARERVRAYAHKRYSPQNLHRAVDALKELHRVA